MSGPLFGLKVIEMAGLGPCPFAGQLMGDLGADVIVIDRKSGPPNTKDVNRRSKRSIALNLKTDEGVETALKLIQSADIVIEGFRPGVMEKLGLGPDICQEKNPELIYGRMTGWGQDGPLSQTAGHDINYAAITGTLHAMGFKDRPPSPPLNFVADYAGGTMFLLFGVLSALHERHTTGKGRVIDAAMVDSIPLMAGIMQTMMASGTWSNHRESNWLDGGAPFYRCYETLDGKYVSIGALEPQFFEELVNLAGIQPLDMADQNDPVTWQDKHTRYEALFKTKTRAQWESVFSGSDACFAPVLDWNEAHAHPHNVARGVFYKADGVTQTTPAPRFDGAPVPRPSLPHAPGADTQQVLEELGIDETDQFSLRNAGALT